MRSKIARGFLAFVAVALLLAGLAGMAMQLAPGHARRAPDSATEEPRVERPAPAQGPPPPLVFRPALLSWEEFRRKRAEAQGNESASTEALGDVQIRGRVVDERGRAVSDARVDLVTDHRIASVDSDRQGHFQLRSFATRASYLTINHPAYPVVATLVSQLPPECEIWIELPTPQHAEVIVRVRDSAGLPLADAQLTNRRPQLGIEGLADTASDRVGTTDSTGACRLRLRPGPWLLWAVNPSGFSDPTRIALLPGEKATLDIVLKARSILELTAREELACRYSVYRIDNTAARVTDGDRRGGHNLVPGNPVVLVLPGGRQRMQLAAREARPVAFEFEVKGRFQIELSCAPRAGPWTLRGSVLGPMGPVDGASVELVGVLLPHVVTTTANGGHFVLRAPFGARTIAKTDVPGLTFVAPTLPLRILADGFCPEVRTITFTARELDLGPIALEPEASVVVEGADLHLFSQTSDSGITNITICSEGTRAGLGATRYRGLRPGTYSVRRGLLAPPIETFTLQAGEHRTVTAQAASSGPR